MSIMRCKICERNIDTDFDGEHFEKCEEEHEEERIKQERDEVLTTNNKKYEHRNKRH